MFGVAISLDSCLVWDVMVLSCREGSPSKRFQHVNHSIPQRFTHVALPFSDQYSGRLLSVSVFMPVFCQFCVFLMAKVHQ